MDPVDLWKQFASNLKALFLRKIRKKYFKMFAEFLPGMLSEKRPIDDKSASPGSTP